MPKYRKTALVDAEQFLPPHQTPAGCFQKGTVADVSAGHGEWMLKTLEGEHSLRGGDYICTGPAGEKWNVEQAIFEATYEPAQPSGEVSQADEISLVAHRLEAWGLKDTPHDFTGHDYRYVAVDILTSLRSHRIAFSHPSERDHGISSNEDHTTQLPEAPAYPGGTGGGPLVRPVGAHLTVSALMEEIDKDLSIPTEISCRVFQAAKRVSAISAPFHTMARPSEKVEIPRDIAEQVLSMGLVEWGATDRKLAADHSADFTETLRKTREHFNFEDVPVQMHGLYLEGTETVLCFTGTSPNSGANAQALAGAWNWLHTQSLSTPSDTVGQTDRLAARMGAEFIPHNYDAQFTTEASGEVVQADREAAASLIETYWSGADDNMMKLAKSYRAGHSRGIFAGAFRDHRLAHSGVGNVVASEKAANYLLRFGNHSQSCGRRTFHWPDARTKVPNPCDCGYEDALNDIRSALSTTEPVELQTDREKGA